VRTRSCLVSLALALSFWATSVTAQQRHITGRVTSATTGDAVVGASVAVLGTTIAALTGDDGRFTLAAPAGDVTLALRRIGFRRKQVAVPAAETAVDATLEPDVFNLEAVVVTGQATGVARQNSANAVATVSAAELERVPAPSVEHMLQGRVAGANIQTNSGAPGGGVQVAFRGVTSVFGAQSPLYVVDGVIVSDAAIPNNQQVVTASNAGSNPSPLQQGQVNRIADLNPFDIENVEVLKGASASAVYGAKASNGVVIITTHRGDVGPPRFNVTQRFGSSELGKALGSRVFTQSEAVAAFGAGAAAYWANDATNPNFGQPDFAPGKVYDNERELAGRKPLSYETGLTVSGGSDATRYFVGGLVENDGGIITNTGFKRQSLRLNLDQRISSRFNVNFNTNLVHSIARRGLTNNDNTGVSYYMALEFIPSFVDLRQKPDGSWGNSSNFVQSNPLQTAALMTNTEDVWRVLSGVRGTLDVVSTERHNLRLLAQGGVDWFGQKNTLVFPPELQFEPLDGEPGTSLLTNGDNLNDNWNVNLVHTYRPGRFAATTAVGMQEEDQDLGISRIISKNLVPNQANVNSGADVSVDQRLEKVHDFGFYGQEELLALDERLLLTTGVRADRSSNNGDQHKYFWYPKAAGSYRFFNPFSHVDELKVRAAWGQTGNRPAYGQRFSELNGAQFISGLPGFTVQGALGDSTIRPERQTELEAGVDAVLLGGRATLEITAYQKSVKDLLLLRNIPQSTGFIQRFQNAGKLRNRGLEVSLGVTPVQRADLLWVFRSNFWLNRSTVTELPDTAGFRVGGFGCGDGCAFLKPGQSASQIVGTTYNTIGKVGDVEPDFKISFSNDVTYRGLNLYMLWDWQHGAEIFNLTKELYDAGQVSADYTDPVSDPLCPGKTQLGPCRLTRVGTLAATYMESASFLKLREITLTYALPPSVVSRFWSGVRDVRLSASGRNLIVVTPYTGADPEVSNFGNRLVERNMDVAPYPRSRSFWFSISVGF